MWKVNGRQTTDAKWWQKFTLPLARWANNKKTFILGYHNKILLAIKCYIYTCRCLSKNLALSAFIYILQYLYSTERMMAIKQENLKVFNNSCNCWSTLLQNRDHSMIHNALCFSSFLLLKKIEKASEMQQPSCKSKSFGLVL